MKITTKMPALADLGARGSLQMPT